MAYAVFVPCEANVVCACVTLQDSAQERDAQQFFRTWLISLPSRDQHTTCRGARLLPATSSRSCAGWVHQVCYSAPCAQSLRGVGRLGHGRIQGPLMVMTIMNPMAPWDNSACSARKACPHLAPDAPQPHLREGQDRHLDLLRVQAARL